MTARDMKALSDSYRGVVVPMVSPFAPGGEIDAGAARRIVDLLVTGGAAGVFPLGTTGEAMSISMPQRLRLVEVVAAHTAGRAKVYAGIPSNCQSESVAAARQYQSAGADCVVAHVPSYYPLNDQQVESYFLRLADDVALPLVIYNIPQTTHHNIALKVVPRLMAHGNIVAIKDSSPDAERLTELLNLTGGRGGFPVLLGNSSRFVHGLRHGGIGLIPSGAHVVGDLYARMMDAALANRWDEVEATSARAEAICGAYLKGRSLGDGLAALKAMLERRGICGRTMLPPLTDHVGDVEVLA